MSTDLSGLSREEKIELLQQMEEAERRSKLKVGKYTPNDGQRPVHMSRKPIRAVFSGNGAGKTCMGANEVKWALDGYNPVTEEYTPSPVTGIVVLDDPAKVNDVWLEEIKKWAIVVEEQLKKDGKPYYVRVLWPNGSVLKFMFHDQDDARFESIEADFVVFDEPPPRSKYIALLRGQRKKGSQPWTLFLGTPLTAAWMRRELWEPFINGTDDTIECFRFSTDVNKNNLNWGQYEKVFFSKLSDEELKMRRHGEFFDLSGLALAHLWDKSVHVIDEFEWPKDWPIIGIVDPHPAKDNAAILLGTDRDGNFYVVNELASRKHAEPFSLEFNDFQSAYGIQMVVVDSLGSAPTSGGDGDISFIDKMNQMSHKMGFTWRARATSYDEKSDEAFIDNIRDVLYIKPETSKPKLFVFRRCGKTISDIENVEWQKHKNKDHKMTKDKLEISNRDYLACVKYGLAAQMAYRHGKPKTKRWKNRSPWSGKKRSIGAKRRMLG